MSYKKNLNFSILLLYINCIFANNLDNPNWPIFGHDFDNSNNNNQETTIGLNNIDKLKLLWKVAGSEVTGVPIVDKGVVYYGDASTIFARNVNTNALIWENKLLTPNSGSFDGNGFRGSVALSDCFIFAASQDGRVFALDRNNGKLIWEKNIAQNQFTIVFGSLVVVESLVIATTASGENFFSDGPYTAQGSVIALKCATGNLKWQFKTTKANSKEGAGVGIFGSPAVDKCLGYLFIGTGQSFNKPAAPLSDSLLALNYRTCNPNGELVWSQQYTKDDTFSLQDPHCFTTGDFDLDLGSNPNLFKIRKNKECGCCQKVVGAADKTGFYRVFDRKTGELVWETHAVPQGTLVSTFGNPSAAIGKELIFVEVLTDPKGIFTGGFTIETSRGQTPQANAKLISALINDVVSVIVALNINTGAIVWKKEILGAGFGSLTTANGVLYRTGFDGFIYALNATNGNIVLKKPNDFPNINVPLVGNIRVPLNTAVAISKGKLFLGAGYIGTSGGILAYNT